MGENDCSDPKWTQDCGEDGKRTCLLHNLHCGYPDCAKGRMEAYEVFIQENEKEEAVFNE